MSSEDGRYRSAFENAFDAIVVADDEGTYIDANQSACDLFGMDKNELMKRSIYEFAPDDYDFESEWDEFQASDGKVDTFPLITANGDHRVVEYTAVPNVAPGEHISVLRDVTKGTERERKLQETQSKYRQLVEQNLIGIYLIQDRTFSYVNPRLAEIFGETPEEMIGRPPFDWIADEDHERVAENLRRREEGEIESLKFTVTGKRSDGEHLDFEVYGGRVDINGEPAILGALQDVTDRKDQERKLKQKNERLEQFANIVSHDLRNPLNVAKGRLDLVRNDVESNHLDEVAQAHRRIETLIEDLLLLARDGNLLAETEPIELAELINGCWQTVETENAELLTTTTAVIQGDKSRLQQLGENLIRNSIEHGGRSVTITVGDLDDAKGFYIEDNGNGISEDKHGMIFTRGYSTSPSGLGEGLSIVKRIADAHGWTINVSEVNGGGTRFEFSGVECYDELIHH